VSQKTPPPSYILNNSAKNEPILIIFGVQNPEVGQVVRQHYSGEFGEFRIF